MVLENEALKYAGNKTLGNTALEIMGRVRHAGFCVPYFRERPVGAANVREGWSPPGVGGASWPGAHSAADCSGIHLFGVPSFTAERSGIDCNWILLSA